MKDVPFNRHVGLMVLDVTLSNPNGDPDMDSEPRTLEADGRGLISPVSVKRKLREMVEMENSPAFEEAKKTLGLKAENFQILEHRGRDLNEIANLDKEAFKTRYWDARLFGNTLLESLKEAKAAQENKKEPEKYAHFINTGTVQVGVGTSIAPIEVVRMTNTNKAGVQSGLDRGMAPLAFKVVQHGIYTVPIYVNPGVASKTGATQKDLDLMQFLLPHAYSQTASAIRPQVSVLHCWFAEHKNALGSCPEHLFLDALTPTVKEGVAAPGSRADYHIPDGLPDDIQAKFTQFEDLNLKEWS